MPTPDTAETTTVDAADFVATIERITNEVRIDDWLGLYAPDAVIEQIIDGAYERHRGTAEIHAAVTSMARLWRARRLRVRKTVECHDASTVVVTWEGGFDGADRQFGTEIWTLRDGRVVHQRTYGFLRVLPRTSRWARVRVMLADPRTAIAAVRAERGNASR